MNKLVKKVILITSLCVIGCFIVFMILVCYIKVYRTNQLEQIYSGWQTISVEEIGSFKVPEEWIFTRKDNIIYLTDKPIDEDGYKIYLVGSIWFVREDQEYKVARIIFEDVEYIGYKENARNQGFSNSAHYAESEYRVGDEIISKYYISFYIHNLKNNVEFISWDDLLVEERLEKIARSFRQPQN